MILEVVYLFSVQDCVLQIFGADTSNICIIDFGGGGGQGMKKMKVHKDLQELHDPGKEILI